MKNNINKFSIFFVVFIYIFFENISYSQGTYFHDADFVFLRNGNPDNLDSVGSTDRRTIYWDLSSIDTNADRIDICIGYNEIYSGFNNDFLWGNWLRNEDNVNFNVENSNLRFIYNSLPVLEDSITGISFISLRENEKKDLVVLRASGVLEIRKNENSSIHISDPVTISNTYGKMPVVGKFTTDTLEDLAVLYPSGIKVLEGISGSEPSLDEIFVLQNYEFKKIYLSQIDKHINPYSIKFGETNDRDEIIAQVGNNIYIFQNGNNNTTSSSPSTTISSSEYLSDFKVADLNNDGYNDIIAITQYDYEFTTYGRILIYLNIDGTINTTPVYNNYGIRIINSVETADFNKDGWNDFIIDRGTDTMSLFINNKTSGLFSNTAAEGFRYADGPGEIPIPPINARKISAVDLYNKGGIGVIMSGWIATTNQEKYESIIRINATTTDAVPAPPIIFKSYVYKNGKTWPKLYLYNRGDRDFNKFRIYKKSPNRHDSTVFVAETSYNTYLDTTENIVVGETEPDSTNYLYIATCLYHTSN